jgi:hypothetical protein
VAQEDSFKARALPDNLYAVLFCEVACGVGTVFVGFRLI